MRLSIGGSIRVTLDHRHTHAHLFHTPFIITCSYCGWIPIPKLAFRVDCMERCTYEEISHPHTGFIIYVLLNS